MPADTNLMTLAFIDEVTFGTIPAGNGAIQDLRFVSESLKQDTATKFSAEIRNDREKTDVVRTSVSTSGDVAFELSYGANDDWLMKALLDSAWAAEVATYSGSAVTAASADNSFNSSAAFTAPAVGAWLEVRGFAAAADNGYCRVVSATTSKIIVSGLTLDAESAGASVTIEEMGFIENGTTLKSMSIEKEYGGTTAGTFEQLRGQTVNTFALDVSSEDILTGTFGLIGKDQLSPSATATFGSGTNVAAATNEVMNSLDNVVGIYIDGTLYSVTSFSLSMNNNLRTRQQVGTLGAISVGTGSIEVTGSVEAYFDDHTQFNKYLAFSTVALALVLEDDAGNGYVVDLPSAKFTGGERVATGENADVMVKLDFSAFRNSTDGRTISIHRFTA